MRQVEVAEPAIGEAQPERQEDHRLVQRPRPERVAVQDLVLEGGMEGDGQDRHHGPERQPERCEHGRRQRPGRIAGRDQQKRRPFDAGGVTHGGPRKSAPRRVRSRYS